MGDDTEEFLDRVGAEPGTVTVEEVVAYARAITPAEVPGLLRALGPLTQDDSDRARAIAEALEPLLADESVETRIAATRALSTLASIHPDAVVPAIPAVIENVEDEAAAVRGAVARTFVALAEHRPDAVRSHIVDLEPLIGDDVTFVGEAAVGAITTLLPAFVDDVIPVLDALVEVMVSPPEMDPLDRRTWMRQHPTFREQLDRDATVASDTERYLAGVSMASALIARERPDAAADFVPSLADALERASSTPIRARLLETVGAIAEHDSAAATPAIDAVVTALTEAHSEALEAGAAWTLAWLGEGAADTVVAAVEGEMPALLSSLETSDDEDLLGAVGALLSLVAERRPARVEPALPRLRELLGAEEPHVRGNALLALAHAGTPEDRERIGRLAREDPNPEIRAVARDALGS